MKKFMMTLAMALTMTVAFAEGDENEKVNSTEAFEMSTHMGQLANALQLTVDQYETVPVRRGHEEGRQSL